MSKEHKLFSCVKTAKQYDLKLFTYTQTCQVFPGAFLVRILHHFTYISNLIFKLPKLRENLKDGIA